MEIGKIIAALPPGFKDEADAMDEATLRDTVVRADARAAEIAREEKADTKPQGAKDLVKDLSGGYRDARKAQAVKTAYCLHRLAEMGSPLVGDLADESGTQTAGQ